MKSKLLLLLVLLCAGCSNEIIVRTDFDKTVSIQKLTHYKWHEQRDIEAGNNPLYYNQLNDKRIRDEVDKQMSAKGYVLSETNAQLLIHYHVAVEERSTFRPEESGYNYSKYWVDRQASLVRYSEGTLIIDFMDVTNCNLIWRGWATSILDNSRIMDEALLRKAVDDIFRKFPESAAKEIVTP
jgi:Domain of unknown function (DUF4136)